MNATRRTVTGLGLIVGGALLGMLAMTALPWYRGNIHGFLVFGTHVSDLRQTISFYQSARDVYDVISFGASPVYFSWLALTMLIVAAIGAAATIGFDGRVSHAVGVAAATVCVAAIVLTALSIQVVDIDAARLEKATTVPSHPPGYTDYLGATSFGAWAMVLAYLAIGVGALLARGGRDAMRDLLNGDLDGDLDPSEEPSEEPGSAPVRPPADEPVPRENW